MGVCNAIFIFLNRPSFLLAFTEVQCFDGKSADAYRKTEIVDALI